MTREMLPFGLSPEFHRSREQADLMRQQLSLLARIADSLEVLAAIAQAEHEASDTVESGEAYDLSGRPI
jgi:hypothetical protein